MAKPIIKSKKDGSLIVISGPTSAGKGTIREELLKKHTEMHYSVSMTTRYQREDEIDGKQYYFVTREKFEEKIKNNEMLEYIVGHHGNYYGTPKDIIEEKLAQGIDVLMEIDIYGALKIKEPFPNAIQIFIMPPDMETLISRLKKRGAESKEKMIERVKTAYQEINEISTYNYVVVNDELEDAVRKVEAIITSEKCRVDRIDAIEVDNKEELLHDLLMEN